MPRAFLRRAWVPVHIAVPAHAAGSLDSRAHRPPRTSHRPCKPLRAIYIHVHADPLRVIHVHADPIRAIHVHAQRGRAVYADLCLFDSLNLIQVRADVKYENQCVFHECEAFC